MVVGGLLGSLVFYLALKIGIHMLAVAGAGVGLGCGYLSRIRSVPLGIGSGVVALVLSILWAWRLAPFIADDSLIYFVQNLMNIHNGQKLMLVCGTLFGGWFGIGRERYRSH